MKRKLLINVLICLTTFVGIYLYAIYILSYISLSRYSNKDFNIETYISKIDKDEDGIDDQSDIIQNVRNYIGNKPQYKSKYYSNGYPDDNYGVCTDVIGFALLNAGYNLMDLVNDDIINNKELYNVEKVDKKIDFRRVKNLKIYFERNAIKLTNDINDIENWQGGDIVIFEKHIGIVSDKRNEKGITLVIHHANPYQKYYEEDILERRNDLIGHYRIS